MNDTESFTVIVADYSLLSIGTNIVQTGQSGSVPITLFASAGLTNLVFEIETPTNRLAGLSLTNLAPEVGLASLQPVSSNRWRIAFGSSGVAAFQGQMQLAALSFVAVSNQSSASVRLAPTNVAATKSDASALTNIFVNAGRVVVIGNEPLLEAQMAQGGARNLILYGKPASIYQLQYASDLSAGGNWNNWMRVPLTNLFQVISGVTTGF